LSIGVTVRFKFSVELGQVVFIVILGVDLSGTGAGICGVGGCGFFF
jgi:hypothetical protein